MVLGEAVLATAPDHDTAGVVERALSGLPAGWLADAGTLSSRLPAVEILGPAALAYLDPAEFRPPPDDAAAAPLNLDHSGFRQFLLTVGDDDVRESGIEQITTPTFAIHENGRVVAAAGYRDWPCGTAQLSVLTASAARGRGLARAAVSAAVAHAIEQGRLPQWRARPPASRRVARALGFRELGEDPAVIIAARSITDLVDFRRLSPRLRSLGLVPGPETGPPDPAAIEEFAQAGADIIRLWPHWILASSQDAPPGRSPLVQRLRDLGKPVWATADTLYGDISPEHPREDLTELVHRGVDGIITNLPELLRDVLAAERRP